MGYPIKYHVPMHIIIFIIFAVTILLAFTEDYMKDIYKVFFLVIYAIVFILLASTKSIEGTADAAGYETMFYNNDDFITELATEPTFIYLSRIVLYFGGTISVIFFIYAIISIPIKLWALYKMTPYIFTALLIYVPVYFELHDMIQIRAAAAAAFLLSSLIPLAQKRYWAAIVLMICAIFFHYSAVAFLPFLLIGNRKLNRIWRVIIALSVPICFVVYFMEKDFFNLIPSTLTEGKLDLYKETAEKGKWESLVLPYKNLYFMTKCIILYLSLYFYDFIVEKNRFAPVLINLFAASLCFLLCMATIPVIASRISDLYGIIDCIVFTFCLYIVYPQYITRICISIVGLYMLIYNMLFTEYFI